MGFKGQQLCCWLLHIIELCMYVVQSSTSTLNRDLFAAPRAHDVREQLLPAGHIVEFIKQDWDI